MRTLRIALVLALGALSPSTPLVAHAQSPVNPLPEEQAARVRVLLQLVQVNALAIRDASEPIPSMQREATQVRDVIEQLPQFTVGQPEFILGEVVTLREDAGRLFGAADAQDTFAAASAASDLLTDLTRFRQAMSL